MGKQALDNALRNDIIDFLTQAIDEHYGVDVLRVAPSAIAFPVLDAEGNEKFGKLVISIPHGTRNGEGYDPYDGYALAQEYKEEQEAKEAERLAKEEAKRREAEAKKRKREEKQKAE